MFKRQGLKNLGVFLRPWMDRMLETQGAVFSIYPLMGGALEMQEQFSGYVRDEALETAPAFLTFPPSMAIAHRGRMDAKERHLSGYPDINPKKI